MRASKLPNKKFRFDFAPEPVITKSWQDEFVYFAHNGMRNNMEDMVKGSKKWFFFFFLSSPVLLSKTSRRSSPSILDWLFPQKRTMFLDILASTWMWLYTITHTKMAMKKDRNFAISIPIFRKIVFPFGIEMRCFKCSSLRLLLYIVFSFRFLV